ncbi:MAG: AMP-binding protein [Flavobacteriaceae bacterium]|jgi:O-succinylbenzoic acid--CoA ligase|nr:AMP-binding protein [Flavobacteriaceae bacterium]
MDIKVIHEDFCLNGKAFNQKELIDLATMWSTGQEEYLIDLAHFILQWFNNEDYIVQQTSGTTGPPKLIELKKEAMLYSAQGTANFFNIPAKSKALLCMSTKFVGGKLMFIRSILCGWHLDVVKPTAYPLKDNTHYYDFVAMVPMQVEHSIEELKQVGTLIIGGAKVSSILAEQLSNLSTRVYETYGMTETITHIAAKRIGDTSFSVLPNIQISTDNRGCLAIHVPYVVKEPIITNDLVNLLAENQFEWLGRIDNVINSGGVKLFPEQIESKLAPFIPWRFFVAGKEDSYFGSKVILVIESQAYDLPLEIFDKLSKFEKPKEIQFVDKFVETASGKILRKENIKK